jgi:hypothetical protein
MRKDSTIELILSKSIKCLAFRLKKKKNDTPKYNILHLRNCTVLIQLTKQIIMKNQLLTFCALLFATGIFAQTKYIAFKSHSGDMNFFFADLQPDDDFGLPSNQIMKIKKINDSTVIEYAIDYGSSKTITDTVTNQIYCSDPNIGLDSLKKIYQGVEFEGFEKSKSQSVEKKAENLKKTKELKKELERAENPAIILPNDNSNNGGNIFLFTIISIVYSSILVFIGLNLASKRKTNIA